MSLLPIDNCTYGDGLTFPGPDFSNIPSCNLSIATTYDTYPSYWTCDHGGSSEDQFCYIVSNTADDEGLAEALKTGHREGLWKAMTECCDGGGPGGFEPCIQWCPYPKDVESWNECLADKGYGPSYNDSGLVRDTYCVPSLKQQGDGDSVEDGDGEDDDSNSTSSEDDADSASSADEAGDMSSATTTNAKFGVALGLILAVPVLGRFL